MVNCPFIKNNQDIVVYIASVFWVAIGSFEGVVDAIVSRGLMLLLCGGCILTSGFTDKA